MSDVSSDASSPTSIRFASRADSVALAEMARDLIEHGLGWTWTKERISRCIRHPDTNAIVAERDSGIAGFAIMKYGEEEAHLVLLAVKPAQARLGVGRLLVEWLERSARIAGVGRVGLEARASNAAARAFYRRMGYAQTQLLPGYYGGRETSVRMVKELATARTGTT